MMTWLISWGSLLVTVLMYFLSRRLWVRFPRIWLSPIITAPIGVIGLLLLLGIPYVDYASKSRWLTWLLGPSVVAFAIPIYEYRQVIVRHWLPLVVGVVVGMVVAVSSSIVLSRLFELPEVIERSLAVRSISTPFAMIAAPKLGGSADLAAIFVVITGILGMILGQALLGWLPIRSALARGALFGAGAHAAGTAAAHARDVEEGVISSLTMIIAGILIVLLAPVILRVF